MITPINSATRTPPASRSTSASKPASKAPVQAAPKDTVRISNAAKQIVQEAIETSTQTTKEAANGDVQAQRLLARESAAKVKAR